ncbi:hypothetical protein NWF32_24885 [Pseudomonas qingdaonensis]|nr:hypothetical protein [Pseudomonas qingdaonensis]
MLRLALIENLRRVASRVMASWADRNLANDWADRLRETAGRDAKSVVLVLADMARSQPPMTAAFVAELARRLQGQSAALIQPLTWVEQMLAESGLSIERQVQLDAQQQAADQVSVSNSIASLRLLATSDWREFVEHMSHVERCCAAILPASTQPWTSPAAIITGMSSNACPGTAHSRRRQSPAPPSNWPPVRPARCHTSAPPPMWGSTWSAPGERSSSAACTPAWRWASVGGACCIARHSRSSSARWRCSRWA